MLYLNISNVLLLKLSIMVIKYINMYISPIYPSVLLISMPFVENPDLINNYYLLRSEKL